jgi:hypothetical protein
MGVSSIRGRRLVSGHRFNTSIGAALASSAAAFWSLCASSQARAGDSAFLQSVACSIVSIACARGSFENSSTHASTSL